MGGAFENDVFGSFLDPSPHWHWERDQTVSWCRQGGFEPLLRCQTDTILLLGCQESITHGCQMYTMLLLVPPRWRRTTIKVPNRHHTIIKVPRKHHTCILVPILFLGCQCNAMGQYNTIRVADRHHTHIKVPRGLAPLLRCYKGTSNRALRWQKGIGVTQTNKCCICIHTDTLQVLGCLRGVLSL